MHGIGNSWMTHHVWPLMMFQARTVRVRQNFLNFAFAGGQRWLPRIQGIFMNRQAEPAELVHGIAGKHSIS